MIFPADTFADAVSEAGVALPSERIESRILLIRGQKVLLDRDLAGLYGVETRILNRAVRRNADRFPGDFMFALSREEITRISQIGTSLEQIKYSKSVMVFTEQGVAMLSGLLNSPRAIAVNIEIMRAFVRLRQLVATHAELARRLSALERKYDAHFKAVFDAIRGLMALPPARKGEIGFHTFTKPGGAPSSARAVGRRSKL